MIYETRSLGGLVLGGLVLGGLVLGGLVLGGLVLGGCGDVVQQPLAFSHSVHVEKQKMKCLDCHKFNRTQTFSGMPGLADCMECHEDAQTKSAEEQKLRDTAKRKQGLAWGRLYRLPDHVYYSHRRHVVLGKIACETCHGEIGKTKRPPSRRPTKVTMRFCIDCHKSKKVSVDCVTCHR